MHKGNGVQVIYGPNVTVIKSNLEDYLEKLRIRMRKQKMQKQKMHQPKKRRSQRRKQKNRRLWIRLLSAVR